MKMNIKCHICEQQFNWEAKLNNHYITVHLIEPEHAYIDTVLGGKKPTCLCGCGESTTWKGWKKGHNDYVRFHNDSGLHSANSIKKAAETRKNGYKSGKYTVWNNGLTRKNDERIANSADKAGQTTKDQFQEGRTAWQKGFTKETHVSLRKASETHKRSYESGKIAPWNKGKTKHTCEKIFDISVDIANTKKNNYDSSTRYSKDELFHMVSQTGFTLVQEYELYRNKYQKLEFECNTCKNISLKTITMINNVPKCFHCNPKESIGQIEISKFINSLGFSEVKMPEREIISPKELDVFVVNKKFAIEFNGLYWHTEFFKEDTLYHENKVEACKSQDIKLFHIFEDEWQNKQPIIKSMIQHKLGVQTNKIYARKCTIKELAVEERRKFFETCHIDGDTASIISWGLVYNNELVAALSLRKFKTESCYELARFSSLLNTSVIGGLGKLLSHAKLWLVKNNAKKLITYADKRHGDGHGYETVGFTYMGDTKQPRFWWTGGEVGMTRVNRLKYKADKSRNMTEREVAEEAGVHKIYGCRNKIYELEIE